MEDKLNPAAVGAFVLLLGAALVAGVLWLAAGVSGKQHYLSYRSVVAESVAGLNIDAPVKYLGVDVGKVRTIAIDPQNSRQVLLGFLILQGTPVKQDSEAVLKTQGLTGIAYVEISGGSLGSPPLLPSAEDQVPAIPSKASLSARLENVLTSVLGNVDRVSSNLNAVFDADNRAALKQTLADTAALAHALSAQQGALVAAIGDAAHTAKNTAKASEQLQPVLARAGPALVRMEAAAGALQTLGEDASRATLGAGLAVDAAASGVQQLRSVTLPELDQLLLQSKQLAASLHSLSEQTRTHPTSLLLGGPSRPPGPGEKPSP